MQNYFLALYRFAPCRTWVLGFLMLITGLLEGFGLLLLLPLLSLAGLSISGQSLSAHWVALTHWLVLHHWQLSLADVLLIYVVVLVFMALLLFFKTKLSSRLQLDFCQHLRHQVYRPLLQANWRFLSQQSLTEMANVLMAAISKVGLVTHYFLDGLSAAILCVAYWVLAFAISWKLALVLFIMGVLVSVPFILLSRQAHQTGKQLNERSQALYHVLLNYWHGLKLMKSLAIEAEQSQRFDAAGQQLSDSQYRYNHISAMTALGTQVGAVLLLSVLFYAGIAIWHVALGVLIVLLVLMARMLPRMKAVQRNAQNLLHLLPAYRDVQMHCQALAQAEEPESAKVSLQLKQQLELRGVGVQYQSPVLSDLDLTLKANTTTVIMGPSGAGKTTLMDVLAGLIFPDQGVVSIDGQTCDNKMWLAWRRQVAYMPQTPFLFAGSIRENLAFGVGSVTDEACWDALKQVRLYDKVQQLPGQLNAKVSERGQTFSGGEQQRLALARVLLHKPQLLLLDEVTSQIDRDNEQLIMSVVSALSGQMTIVMVTHRQENVVYADQMITLSAVGC